MEQVREEAGVSAGLMYRYFPSKDDMLRAAISGSMLQFEALITEVGSNREGHDCRGVSAAAARHPAALPPPHRRRRLVHAGDPRMGARPGAPTDKGDHHRKLCAPTGVISIRGTTMDNARKVGGSGSGDRSRSRRLRGPKRVQRHRDRRRPILQRPDGVGRRQVGRLAIPDPPPAPDRG